MKTEPSVHSPFQNLDVGNSILKACKSRCQSFLVLSKFTIFPDLPDVLFCANCSCKVCHPTIKLSNLGSQVLASYTSKW